MAFDAGEIKATADLDTDPFIRNLRLVRTEGNKLAGETFTPSIGADTKDADAKIDDVNEKLRKVSDSKTSAKVTADTTEALLRVQPLVERLQEIRDRVSTARVDANTDAARIKLDRLDIQLRQVGQLTARPKVTLDGIDRAELQVDSLELRLRALGATNARPSVGSGSGAGGGGFSGALKGLGGAAPGLKGLAIGAGLTTLGPLTGALLGAGASLITPLTALTVGVGSFGLAAHSAITKVQADTKTLTALQAKYNAATSDKTRAAAQAAELKFWNSLSPAEQQAVNNLHKLSAEWGSFTKSLQPEVFHLVSGGVGLAATGLKLLQPVAKATGLAFEGLEANAESALTNPFWHRFFTDFLPGQATLATQSFTLSLGHLATGWAHMAKDFAPLGRDLENSLERVTTRFENWTEGPGPAKFVAWVQKNGPIIGHDLTEAADGIGHIATALIPLGLDVLGGIGKLGHDIDEISPAHIRDIAEALLAVGISLKVIAAADKVIAITSTLGTLGRIGGGGAAAAEGAAAGRLATGAVSLSTPVGGAADVAAAGALGSKIPVAGAVLAIALSAKNIYDVRNKALTPGSAYNDIVRQELGSSANPVFGNTSDLSRTAGLFGKFRGGQLAEQGLGDVKSGSSHEIDSLTKSVKSYWNTLDPAANAQNLFNDSVGRLHSVADNVGSASLQRLQSGLKSTESILDTIGHRVSQYTAGTFGVPLGPIKNSIVGAASSVGRDASTGASAVGSVVSSGAGSTVSALKALGVPTKQVASDADHAFHAISSLFGLVHNKQPFDSSATAAGRLDDALVAVTREYQRFEQSQVRSTTTAKTLQIQFGTLADVADRVGSKSLTGMTVGAQANRQALHDAAKQVDAYRDSLVKQEVPVDVIRKKVDAYALSLKNNATQTYGVSSGVDHLLSRWHVLGSQPTAHLKVVADSKSAEASLQRVLALRREIAGDVILHVITSQSGANIERGLGDSGTKPKPPTGKGSASPDRSQFIVHTKSPLPSWLTGEGSTSPNAPTTSGGSSSSSSGTHSTAAKGPSATTIANGLASIANFAGLTFVNELNGTGKEIRQGIVSMIDKLNNAVRNHYLSSDKTLVQTLHAAYRPLERLAKGEVANAKALSKAQSSLSTLRSDAASTRSGTLSAYQGLGDLSQVSTFGSVSNLLSVVGQQDKAGSAFTRNLATLRKKGLSKEEYDELQQAGPAGAGQVVALLATATSAQIKSLNSKTNLLTALGISTGKASANYVYGARINTAQGAVKADRREGQQLRAEQTNLTKALDKFVKTGLHDTVTHAKLDDVKTLIAETNRLLRTIANSPTQAAMNTKTHVAGVHR